MSSYRGGIYLQNNRKVTFFVLRERYPAAREAFGSEATSEAVEALLAAPHSASRSSRTCSVLLAASWLSSAISYSPRSLIPETAWNKTAMSPFLVRSG